MNRGITFIVVAFIYLVVLISLAVIGNRKNKGDSDQFFLAGGNIGTIIGFLTFFATLYSTFILIGMPDFFRVHGVGTWIFLGVTDMVLAFFTLWLAMKMGKRIASADFRSMTDILKDGFGTAGIIIYVIGLLIFLVPYIAIQVKGASELLSSVVPYDVPLWVWAVTILLLMYVYSSIGGLRGIMYADSLQGIMLFSVIWIMAAIVLMDFGGIKELVATVKETKPELLSAPGPNGLLNVQWLLAAFISIVLLPVSQPQLTSRLGILKGFNERRKVPVLHASFTFLLLIAGLIIGLYGAVAIPAKSGPEFIGQLILEQHAVLGAITLIGILAAAMSTADSQFFALGSEINNVFSKYSKKLNIPPVIFVKAVIFILCLASFIVAMKSPQELISLAINGFMGTALMAPMVLVSILYKDRVFSLTIPLFTAISLIIFLLSLFGFAPEMILGLRTDLLLLSINTILTIIVVLVRSKIKDETISPKI